MDQIIEACLCPINRWCVKNHYGLDDHGLFLNPKLLIDWYIAHGGAAEFAKKRAKYEEEVPEEDFQI